MGRARELASGGRSVLTALVVRVGSPAFPGTQFMLRNNPADIEVRIVGADCNPLSPERFLVDAFHVVPPSCDEQFPAAINAICQRESIDVILVQHDVDALALSASPPNRGRLLISDSAALAVCCDKATFLNTCRKQGLPCADWELVDQLAQLRPAAQKLGYPERDLVIKPATAWGGNGFRVVSEREMNADHFFNERAVESIVSLDTLERILTRVTKMPRLLLMEYLPGQEYSVDAFRGGSHAVAIPRVRTRLQGGVAAETVLESRQDLMDYTLQAAEALDLRFVFGMQYRLNHAGIPCILECNPRIQGTAIASYVSGINLIWLAVCEALGWPSPPIPSRLAGGSYVRRWGGVVLGPHGHTVI